MKRKIVYLVSLLALFSWKNLSATENDHSMPGMEMDHSKHMQSIYQNSKMRKQKRNQETFSKSSFGLPIIAQTPVVPLTDGQTYTLEAAIVKQKIKGKWMRRFAYNGAIPGPIFDVKQGSKVKILFINHTDMDQTIHPHGLRLNYRFDGAPGISQMHMVKPGGQFVYELSFPDEGIFWYHPHVREDYAQDMGLYGNIIVRPQNKNEVQPVNQEKIVTLDDILVGKEAAPFFKEYANYAAMGRYGNVMLINGRENNTFTFYEGEVVRFYVTNTANTRTFNLKIPGAKLKLIGSDMSKYENESFVDHVVIAPSERYIIDAFFEEKGNLQMLNQTPNKTTVLANIHVKSKKNEPSYEKQFFTLHEAKEIKNEIKNLSAQLEKPVDKSLILSAQTHMNPHDQDSMHMMHVNSDSSLEKIEWEDNMPAMNEMMTSHDIVWQLIDEQTQKKNMAIQWSFKQGQFYKIKIFNDPKSPHPMQHPIHFHGQRFLVVSHNGVKTTNFVWKDTVLIPAGDTVEILLDASNPGYWMAHCHIAEHLSSGMMLHYQVQP